jgi:hypothetical protein
VTDLPELVSRNHVKAFFFVSFFKHFGTDTCLYHTQHSRTSYLTRKGEIGRFDSSPAYHLRNGRYGLTVTYSRFGTKKETNPDHNKQMAKKERSEGKRKEKATSWKEPADRQASLILSSFFSHLPQCVSAESKWGCCRPLHLLGAWSWRTASSWRTRCTCPCVPVFAWLTC